MGPAEAIRDLAEPPLAAAGLELWDVELSADVVRLLVDRPGGVTLDSLSLATTVVSPLLDEHPELVPANSYQLEVSSPGVERTLRTVAQYHRYQGHPIAVKTSEPVAGSRRLRGTLDEVNEDGIRIALDDPPVDSGPVTVPYDIIQRTRTVLVWGPAPKPGRRAPSTHPSPAKDAT